MTPAITLRQCVEECLANKDFVKEYDRLSGTNLARQGAPINIAVDDAAGKTADDVAAFVAFVERYVYRYVVKETAA